MDANNFLYQFRVIVVGDRSVGKSALILRFTEDIYRDVTDTTVGVDFYAKFMSVDEDSFKRIKLQLWDTAGQERYRAITRSYYKNSAGCVLVFDLTNRQTFQNANNWLDEAKTCSEVHEPLFILVGTKCDLEAKRQVSFEEATKYAAKNGFEYVETSAKKDINVQEAFKKLASNIYRDVSSRDLEEGWEGIRAGPALPRDNRRLVVEDSVNLTSQPAPSNQKGL